MKVVSLGKIAISTPGTPVPITTDFSIRACKITVSQSPSGTGNTFFGTLALNKATGAGVVKAFIPAGTSGFLDEHEITDSDGGNTLLPADFAVDGDTAGNGLFVSYTVQ